MQAISFIRHMLSLSLFSIPAQADWALSLLILGMFCIEWLNRDSEHGLAFTNSFVRRLLYFVLLFLIARYWGDQQQFIYQRF